MSGWRHGWGVLPLAALLSGGCGWFAASKSQPAGSMSDVVRTREAQSAPRGISPVPRGSPLARDSTEVVDRVVAVVNNDSITLSELLETEAYYLYESKQPAPKEGERALQERLLQQMVESRLQLQEAQREKITVEESEIAEQLEEVMKRAGVKSQEEFERVVKAQGLTMEGVRKRIREQVMIQRVVRRKVGLRVSVTEDEIERYFRENREKLETGFRFQARHILFRPRSPGTDSDWEAVRLKAEEVWGMLRAGQDFAELARKYSQDPSAQDGGDLGVMKQGELAPELETQILRLRPGDTAGPFRSKLGYHIFTLEWKEGLTSEALAQTKEQIRQILFRQKYQIRLKDWLEEVHRRAVVEIRL
jgi:peptidyl-prolyl cis-trans isomerase SurA